MDEKEKESRIRFLKDLIWHNYENMVAEIISFSEYKAMDKELQKALEWVQVQ